MKRTLTLTLLLFAASLGPRDALAQTPNPGSPPAPARERLAVTVIQVKPEAVMEFENMIRTEINPALAKGGAKWSDVWKTATFGNGFEYFIVGPIESFAQYDSPGPLMKGLGREGYGAWAARAGKLVNGLRTFAMEFNPELSHETKMTGPPKMGVLSLVSVAPGRGAEFESYIRSEMLPVVKRSGVAGYWFHQSVMGANPNEYVTLVLQDNFADLEKGPPWARVLGREGAAKLMQKLAPGVVTHVDLKHIRLAPELTYRPSQAANK